MSQSERGSMLNLKRSLPAARAPQVAPTMESHFLGATPAAAEQGGEVSIAEIPQKYSVHTEPDPPAPPPPATIGRAILRAQPGKVKDVTVPKTYRLPSRLYDQLNRVAGYNNLTMTEIIVEALELHLPNFQAPPAAK